MIDNSPDINVKNK